MLSAVWRARRRACARLHLTEPRNRAGVIGARNRAAVALGVLGCALVTSGAWAQGAEAYSLSVSTSSSRSSAATLAGQTYETSSIYVFTTPTTGVKKVSFYLNDSSRSRPPRREEVLAPYDFNGTNTNDTAIGYPLNSLTSGSTYTITAAVLGGSTQVVSGSFKIAGAPPPPPPPPGGTLRFADEFNGSSLNTTNWNPFYSAGHNGNGLRRPSAFSVAGGSLVVTAKMVDGKIESGSMAHRADYTYGRYEFRVRTEQDPTGTMSGVVMTWPKYQWSPEFTENDMYETGTSTARNPFFTFIHYGTLVTTQKYFKHYVDATQWHTVASAARMRDLRATESSASAAGKEIPPTAGLRSLTKCRTRIRANTVHVEDPHASVVNKQFIHIIGPGLIMERGRALMLEKDKSLVLAQELATAIERVPLGPLNVDLDQIGDVAFGQTRVKRFHRYLHRLGLRRGVTDRAHAATARQALVDDKARDANLVRYCGRPDINLRELRCELVG